MSSPDIWLFMSRPIRISGQDSAEPKFATGTRTPLIESGAYPTACCTACPHSCAATPIAATEDELYTVSESPSVFFPGL